MSRIQTNVAALNAHRNLGRTESLLARSIARLSSGFRINRAADDAAGLSIANKLRSDVRAMRQAARNGSQANSVLQIADGALQTLSDMIDRMKELAAQSASDNVSSTQRQTLDQEFQTLVAEFERIVQTTQYQGTVLLNGTFGNTVDTDPLNSTLLAAGTEVQSVSISGVDADTYTVSQDAVAETLTLTNSGGTLTQVVDVSGSTGINNFSFSKFGVTIQTTTGFDSTAATAAGDIVVTGSAAKFLVSISGDYSGNDQISISNVDVTTTTLGLDTIDLLDRGNAESSLTVIDSVITNLASAIGDIGAAESRIDFTLANVNSTIENIAAAQSVVRDADMAFEMIDFTKGQILQQAGVAMLAQANATPQAVLALLAG